MWLDELAELVRTLRARAEKYGDSLRKNETRTRYALIDPLLTGLGWNVSDPAVVTPEFDTEEGRPDYALLSDQTNGRPVAFLEAKRLGTPLKDKLSQVITYCNSKGVQHCVVTDGIEWAAYEVFRKVPDDEKLITKFALTMPEHEVVMKMLWLWRGNFNFLHGTPVAAAEPPVLVTPTDPTGSVTGQPRAFTPAPSQTTSNFPVNTPSGTQSALSWVPLDRVTPSSRAPKQLKLSNSTIKSISYWTDIYTEVAKYMVSQGIVLSVDCPVVKDRAYLIHNEPKRANGSEIPQTARVDIGSGMYIDTGKNPEALLRATLDLLEVRHQKPSEFLVEF